jgi:hypothetical protein
MVRGYGNGKGNTFVFVCECPPHEHSNINQTHNPASEGVVNRQTNKQANKQAARPHQLTKLSKAKKHHKNT